LFGHQLISDCKVTSELFCKEKYLRIPLEKKFSYNFIKPFVASEFSCLMCEKLLFWVKRGRRETGKSGKKWKKAKI
jgi:hypothetical protein